MLNQVILVGRLTHDIVLEKCKDKDKFQEGKNYAVITLAIPRSFKNADGVYDTDFISTIAYDNIATNTAEYISKGDIVGVKGRTAKSSQDSELQIIAEKVTFLSKSKSEESE